ncbi:MAG: type II toxin-antitoxin system HicB family antitoxin [Lachnospiraceae bacterium]|nr:type II toxin-antitoxin system HicB family antitoxin [Lachnospiraceae bacterium]
MKTIEYYMRLPYRLEVVPDPDEGGYVVRYPDLPGCISVGETMNEVLENAEDAKRAWISAALEEGIMIPEPSADEQYSGQFKLRIPKSLHRSLAEHAKAEGTSMNQYCLYLLSRNDALKVSN